MSQIPPTTGDFLARTDEHIAHLYKSMPVVLASAEGVWITDVEGRRFLDCLAGYSAVNFGHKHPVLTAIAKEQLDNGLIVAARDFPHNKLADFGKDLATLCNMELAILMNSGAEAVETSLKVARKWGYQAKKVPQNQAEIIVAKGNFHGRTISIISFSDSPGTRDDFGPHTPGFVLVPYGNLEAMAAAINPNTVAVLIEPVQGEGGVIVPPDGYLAGIRQLCDANNVLFIADEIQSGLGRTGKTFACDFEGVQPDLYVLGKALGGGIATASAVVGRNEVIGLMQVGQHGSTFGGNALACAVGHAVIQLLLTGEYQARAERLGIHLRARLDKLVGHGVTAVRSRGLWAGIDLDPNRLTGIEATQRLLEFGVIAKYTRGQTLRFSPPLVITEEEIDFAVDQLGKVLKEAA